MVKIVLPSVQPYTQAVRLGRIAIKIELIFSAALAATWMQRRIWGKKFNHVLLRSGGSSPRHLLRKRAEIVFKSICLLIPPL